MKKSCVHDCFSCPYDDCVKFRVPDRYLTKMQKYKEDDFQEMYVDFIIPFFRKHFKVGQVFKEPGKNGRRGKITAIYEPFYIVVKFSKGYNECFLITDLLKEGFYDKFKSAML